MAKHETQIVWTEDRTKVKGKCSCRATGPLGISKQAAEDWVYQHERQVARARAHLGRAPALPTVVKQYREASLSEAYTPEQRELWAMMADELEARIAMNVQDQLALIEEDPSWRRAFPQRHGS